MAPISWITILPVLKFNDLGIIHCVTILTCSPIAAPAVSPEFVESHLERITESINSTLAVLTDLLLFCNMSRSLKASISLLHS